VREFVGVAVGSPPRGGVFVEFGRGGVVSVGFLEQRAAAGGVVEEPRWAGGDGIDESLSVAVRVAGSEDATDLGKRRARVDLGWLD
jgi:hypothetical protein